MNNTDAFQVMSSTSSETTMTSIDTIEEKKQSSPLFNFVKGCVSGSAGGMAGVIVGHPMDTLKVRLQTMENTSTLSLIKDTLAREKLRGFYKGMLSPLLGEMSNNCILFGVYKGLDSFQAHYANRSDPHYSIYKESAAIGLSGAAAGVVMSLIVCPTELVKIQLQTNMDAYGQERQGKRGFNDCVRFIAREHGFRGLFHGMSSTLSRELMFNTVYFLSYERSKAAIKRRFPDAPATTCLVAGGLAGMAAWGMAYPFDVIKSKVQSDFGQTMRSVIASRKARYYRGFSLTMLRAFPVNAVTFLAYEMVSGAFDAI